MLPYGPPLNRSTCIPQLLVVNNKIISLVLRLQEFAKLYDVIKNERNKCVNQIQTSTQVINLHLSIVLKLSFSLGVCFITFLILISSPVRYEVEN